MVGSSEYFLQKIVSSVAFHLPSFLSLLILSKNILHFIDNFYKKQNKKYQIINVSDATCHYFYQLGTIWTLACLIYFCFKHCAWKVFHILFKIWGWHWSMLERGELDGWTNSSVWLTYFSQAHFAIILFPVTNSIFGGLYFMLGQKPGLRIVVSCSR